jgi:ABC-2 type transport system ATP-binding protein
MDKEDYAIKASNLTKSFGSAVAVDDVSFTVSKGEMFGFLGPNGAGKTTTIRMLTGILTPDKGNIMIDGIDLGKNPIQAKMRMGVIPEIGNVYVDLTAKQNLSLTGRYYGLPKNTIEKKTEELLKSLGIYERRNDQVRTFSKGMKQRISIACAIIHEPQILFLDEPTEGLDVQSKRLIVDIIYRMNKQGCTVFLTTHDIEEANKLCERVCIINKGKIVAMDRPEKLKSAFDKTQSIEVSFDRKIEAELLLHNPIIKVEVFGDKWRLYTTDPDRAIKYVVALAQERGMSILSLTTCGPSLEEAFIRLTGGGE